MSETIVIKHERLLVNLFYYLLSKGITKPVSEKLYFAIANETAKRIREDTGGYVTGVEIENESFENIVTKANTLCDSTKNAIKLCKQRGILVAKAQYNLRRPVYRPQINMGWYTRQEEIFEKVVDSKMKSVLARQSNVANVSEEQLIVAKKVAAWFVNRIIEKYIRSEVAKHRWPSQCTDIDEYVFKRNIAKYIAEEGTAEIFALLYQNATIVACRLIKENKGTFIVCNRPSEVLAYANYIKLLDKSQFKFLQKLYNNPYEMKNTFLMCEINGKNVTYHSCMCVDSDPYDGDGMYKRDSGVVSEKEIEIIETRIANIHNLIYFRGK